MVIWIKGVPVMPELPVMKLLPSFLVSPAKCLLENRNPGLVKGTVGVRQDAEHIAHMIILRGPWEEFTNGRQQETTKLLHFQLDEQITLVDAPVLVPKAIMRLEHAQWGRCEMDCNANFGFIPEL